MTGVSLVPIPPDPIIREWCVFFTDGERYAWWDRFTKKGFRHVAAAGYSARHRLWVVFDPTRAGIRFEVFAEDDEAVNRRLGEILHCAGYRYLRVRAGTERGGMPLLFGCVGGLKALLGVRCGATTPYGLFRHLIAKGAEQVTVPQPEATRVETVRSPQPVDGCERGSSASPAGQRAAAG